MEPRFSYYHIIRYWTIRVCVTLLTRRLNYQIFVVEWMKKFMGCWCHFLFHFYFIIIFLKEHDKQKFWSSYVDVEFYLTFYFMILLFPRAVEWNFWLDKCRKIMNKRILFCFCTNSHLGRLTLSLRNAL